MDREMSLIGPRDHAGYTPEQRAATERLRKASAAVKADKTKVTYREYIRACEGWKRSFDKMGY